MRSWTTSSESPVDTDDRREAIAKSAVGCRDQHASGQERRSVEIPLGAGGDDDRVISAGDGDERLGTGDIRPVRPEEKRLIADAPATTQVAAEQIADDGQSRTQLEFEAAVVRHLIPNRQRATLPEVAGSRDGAAPEFVADVEMRREAADRQPSR